MILNMLSFILKEKKKKDPSAGCCVETQAENGLQEQNKEAYECGCRDGKEMMSFG